MIVGHTMDQAQYEFWGVLIMTEFGKMANLPNTWQEVW